MRPLLLLVLAAGVLLVIARPAGPPRKPPSEGARATATPTATATATATPTPRPRRPIRRARCPQDAANCAAVVGRVLYVEAVDPDGDGDAHYVLAGGNVTAPGLTIVDVARDLRPRRLPRTGDQVSAAGPVYPGSRGQHQIQATEVHYRRR